MALPDVWVCPWCGHEQEIDYCEDMPSDANKWFEPIERECHKCEEVFFVKFTDYNFHWQSSVSREECWP